jgi:hypothetical protein
MASLPLVTTAAEALDRYKTAIEGDQLIQFNWHDQAGDGRWLACALGVIGDGVNRPETCPASVMPTWLAQVVPPLFDGLPFDAAKQWGLSFYEALAQLNGDVPFRVYHRWMAECVLPLAAESASQTPGAEDAVKANEVMIELHTRARDGDMPSESELAEAREAASSAAWTVAPSAASVAKWSAAWSAAEAAKWSAARLATRSAARSAVWSAAEATSLAAQSAVWLAAIERLAHGLVNAMLAEVAAGASV